MSKLKVLIPTDFSVESEYSMILVKKLAEKIPMEVHFLHVLNLPETVSISSNGEINTCGEIDLAYVTSLVSIAKEKFSQLAKSDLAIKSTNLTIGKTTAEIIGFAEKNDFDLIAMGTKGARGIKEKISGSDTQHVARKSKVPLLSLMCDRSNLAVSKILLVHNFEENQEQDLSILKHFVTSFQAETHFLQIEKNSSMNHQKILADMHQFAQNNQLSNYETHILNDSDVESGVNHFDLLNSMDIVFIGTHGKGNLFHASATEKLVNHLHKPIISFQLN